MVPGRSKERLLLTAVLWEQRWQGQCPCCAGFTRTAHGAAEHKQPRNLLAGVRSFWEVKSRGQVQISQYTARHMHSFIIVDTRIRIQGNSWAKAESLCLPQPFLTRVWCKIIKLHNLFICGFLVPSSPFSKSPHSVKVLNSMYIENFQYHKSSHVHLFSPQLSLNIFVLGETELTLEQCASLSSVWHWKNC